MTPTCPPHIWSATPLQDERGKSIFKCATCGTYITGDCRYLTEAEVQQYAAAPEAVA
jgi:hypothetical protein